MSDPHSEASSLPPSRSTAAEVQPSWKPLIGFAAGLAAVIALGEVFFDLALEGLEMLGHGIFYAVEGSEELLEDKIEEWFDLDPYHAEIATAWLTTPIKLLLAFSIVRALWRLGRWRLFPKLAAYLKRQWAAVRLLLLQQA